MFPRNRKNEPSAKKNGVKSDVHKINEDSQDSNISNLSGMYVCATPLISYTKVAIP